MSRPVERLPMLEAIRTRLAPEAKARILAFGSSNTERFLPGMHWFDIVELAIRDTYGRFHRCINTGQCGDTTRKLLDRFDADAGLYRPQLVILTIGGNDSDPVNGISPAQFEANLGELHRRFDALDCRVVFQTYYAPDPARYGNLPLFRQYMELVRRVAQRTGSHLIDPLPRWEAFLAAHNERYLALMQDGLHLNRRGNAVLGLYAARCLGACPAADGSGFWDEALGIQKTMDQLSERAS